MKIVAIGDIHARDIWQDIVKQESFDHLVFIGDYFDTWADISASSQVDNFKNILELKQRNMDTVHLLIGNHDYHYSPSCSQQYSGYQSAKGKIIHDVVKENLSLLQIAYVNDNYLFTHAGVTNTWWHRHLTGEPPTDDTVEDIINDLFLIEPEAFGFDGFRSRTGDEVTQGPLWVRPFSLDNDKIPHFTQVVGHTASHHLEILDGLILIDTFDETKEYLVINDGTPEIKILDNE